MDPKIFIETERLRLRQWKTSDHSKFIQMNQDADVMQYFPAFYTEEESLAFIKRVTEHIDQKSYGLFAVELKSDNSFIGFTGLNHPRFEADFTPCVEIGWRLQKRAWNKGLATEAAAACLQYGFEHAGLNEIYSFTAELNKPSEKVMQKIGMQLQGMFYHPMVEKDHPLQKHVLYKITRAR